MVQDDRFDDLVHVRLTGHLVQSVRRGQEGGAEHDGQVPSIHHVLVAVLREAVGGGKQMGAVIFIIYKPFINMNIKGVSWSFEDI